MQNLRPFYDITIIGSGIVGLTLACALGDSRLKIAIIDGHKPTTQWPEDSIDARVSAITPASKNIFNNLKVWSKIIERRSSNFDKMHVWDAEGTGSIEFDAAAIGTDTLGYIIENRVIQAALYEQLQNHSNIELICSAKLESFKINNNVVNLELTDNQHISTELLIGADGAESQVRKLANIDITIRDYGHSAIVATVRTSLPHEATARQRFLPNGILAFLPLSDPHICSIVWSTNPEEAERLMQLDTVSFNKLLAESFVYRLGNTEIISERAVFPLRMRHAKNYVAPQLALIGDAAHTIHPLAGQGVNLGLLDAAVLAEVILSAQKKNRSINSLNTLRRYERWRKSENCLMLATVEAIKRLFASKVVPITTLRTLGLSLTDKTDFIKNYLMRRAMGVVGDQPQLARHILSRDY